MKLSQADIHIQHLPCWNCFQGSSLSICLENPFCSHQQTKVNQVFHVYTVGAFAPQSSTMIPFVVAPYTDEKKKKQYSFHKRQKSFQKYKNLTFNQPTG